MNEDVACARNTESGCNTILWKNENAVYRSQIPALVPEISKFENCVKYPNEMTDDVIHSTQYYIKYINLENSPKKARALIG